MRSVEINRDQIKAPEALQNMAKRLEEITKKAKRCSCPAALWTEQKFEEYMRMKLQELIEEFRPRVKVGKIVADIGDLNALLITNAPFEKILKCFKVEVIRPWYVRFCKWCMGNVR